MSIIHVNQIESSLSKLFEGKIEMRDAGGQGAAYENQFLSRALAAYAIHLLSGADPTKVAMSITDGGNDNGLDAIFFHEPEKKLYVVPSKWIHDGSGEPSNGDMKKFVAGTKNISTCALIDSTKRFMQCRQCLLRFSMTLSLRITQLLYIQELTHWLSLLNEIWMISEGKSTTQANCSQLRY